MKLTSAPRLSASMTESSLYQTMGVGLTDTILLLGHADGLPINDPYPVVDLNETIGLLGSTTNSPLTFGMIDAYLAGARDIWIVPVAPMDEYEVNRDERDSVYYQRYADRLSGHDPDDERYTDEEHPEYQEDPRLETDYYDRYGYDAIEGTYDVLKMWDRGQITVPLEAPFNATVDFLIPLANYCVEALNESGEIHIGLLGTTGEIDTEMAQAMSVDPRLEMLDHAGKYVAIFAGDVSIRPEGFSAAHTVSAVSTVAGTLSHAPLDRSMAYRRLTYVRDIVGRDLDKELINELSEAGVNLVGRNIRGRRGASFEVIPFTDNTLAMEGSDYWSLAQVRLTSVVSSTIRSIGQRGIGTIGFDLFRDRVRNYLMSLTASNVIKDYDLQVERDTSEKTRVLVEVNLRPYFGVREIYVPIVVSPEEISGSRWSMSNEDVF